MRQWLLLTGIVLLGWSNSAHASIISNIKSLAGFKLVSENPADEGKCINLVFEPGGGIFSFNIDLARPAPAKITFRIIKPKAWEGVTFKPVEGKELDLKHTPGVTIADDDKDCLITFNADAIKFLSAGGRFQFIDHYR